jgi:release factor glutamine methyltransferase
MTSGPSTSITDLIVAATERLRGAGVVKPRREANRLWAWLNRATPGAAWLERDRAATDERRQAYERAIERRIAGEPLDYVLGWSGFRRLELRCDRRALIPRPESEGIVEHALLRARTGRVADLGTGTGCLALALRDEGSYAEIIATDISPAALELAGENVRATRREVHLVRSDFGAGLRDRWFDLVVTNPPYLTDAEWDSLDPSVAEWEPRLALTGGRDGLAAVRRALAHAERLLVQGGWLVMELDSTRSAVVRTLAAGQGFPAVTVHEDLFGRPRYLVAQREGERS